MKCNASLIKLKFDISTYLNRKRGNKKNYSQLQHHHSNDLWNLIKLKLYLTKKLIFLHIKNIFNIMMTQY